jgi:hypothetical protein
MVLLALGVFCATLAIAQPAGKVYHDSDTDRQAQVLVRTIRQ